MKIIKRIIGLENTIFFHFWDFITFKFEYYVRIFFPIAFASFILSIFVSLTDSKPLLYSVIMLEIMTILGLIGFFVIKTRWEAKKKLKQR